MVGRLALVGSSALVGCDVVGVLWWVSVVHEWVVGFNTMSVWVGLCVDQCVSGGGCGCGLG